MGTGGPASRVGAGAHRAVKSIEKTHAPGLPVLPPRPGGSDRAAVRRVSAPLPQVPAARFPRLDRVLGLLPRRPRSAVGHPLLLVGSEPIRAPAHGLRDVRPRLLPAARSLAVPEGPRRVAAGRD